MLAREHILYDAARQSKIDTDWFAPNYWTQQQCVKGWAQGRGNTLFFSHQDQDYVLRHYRRGGLVSKCLSDQYLWLGLQQTRAWREWKLLAKLRDLGLPGPVPVAARVQRKGVYYRADLITERIGNACSLAEKLTQGPLDNDLWRQLGKVVGDFHNAGVDHADLNAHNVLIQNNQFFLIDFDRGRMHSRKGAWCASNMKRFYRSLRKLRGLHPQFCFKQDDWHTLLDGYAAKTK